MNPKLHSCFFGKPITGLLPVQNVVWRLMAFTKRPNEAVAADSELQLWLECRQVKGALAPGLPPAELIQWGGGGED